LLHFGLGMMLSFIGSIPFGTINVTTAETAMREGMRVAVWVALGAALIEWGQSLICLLFSGYLTDHPGIVNIFEWASLPIFLGLAVYFFRRKDKTPETSSRKGSRRHGFVKGVIVSVLNFLAIPYWIFYAVYLESIGWINLDSTALIVLFSIGVVTGTFFILLVYAKLGLYARQKLKTLHSRIAVGLSALFLLLAIVQVTRLVLL
jgi:threonine/homoserine/homoserine lactone efflux protein